MGNMIKAGAPKELFVKVKELNKIKPDIFLLSFDSVYLSKNSWPGQFLHIKIIKTILRRPFSVHCIKGKTVFILFRIRGRGTKILSEYKPGNRLNIIGPLGKGFNIRPQAKGQRPQKERNIIVAGGLGVAPLLFLAQRLTTVHSPYPNTLTGTSGHKQSIVHRLVLLGANTKKEILCEQEFKNMGYRVIIATEDDSKGYKGTVTGLLKKLSTIDYRLSTNIYACGPEAMFKGIKKVIGKSKNVNCQVSFEQFMGCGLGICCGCAIETKAGYKKVCKDGPVFDLKDIYGNK